MGVGHGKQVHGNRKRQDRQRISIFPLELNTMPGFAGSSAYYLRYMDPRNTQALGGSRKLAEYWKNVDLYVGGTEHATGHLIYSRFWNKFLHDLRCIGSGRTVPEARKPGHDTRPQQLCIPHQEILTTFVSLNLKDQYEVTPTPCGCKHRIQ